MWQELGVGEGRDPADWVKGGAFQLGIEGLGGPGLAHRGRKNILEKKDSLGEGSEAGSRSGWPGLIHSVQQGRARHTERSLVGARHSHVGAVTGCCKKVSSAPCSQGHHIRDRM